MVPPHNIGAGVDAGSPEHDSVRGGQVLTLDAPMQANNEQVATCSCGRKYLPEIRFGFVIQHPSEAKRGYSRGIVAGRSAMPQGSATDKSQSGYQTDSSSIRAVIDCRGNGFCSSRTGAGMENVVCVKDRHHLLQSRFAVIHAVVVAQANHTDPCRGDQGAVHGICPEDKLVTCPHLLSRFVWSLPSPICQRNLKIREDCPGWKKDRAKLIERLLVNPDPVKHNVAAEEETLGPARLK